MNTACVKLVVLAKIAQEPTAVNEGRDKSNPGYGIRLGDGHSSSALIQSLEFSLSCKERFDDVACFQCEFRALLSPEWLDLFSGDKSGDFAVFQR